MDLLIFFIGIFCICKKKYHFAFICLFELLSSYFMLGNNISQFPITHNVSDIGYLLMIILLINGLNIKKRWIIPDNISICKNIIYFLVVFIAIKCAVEYALGISVINILKVYRSWMFYGVIPLLITCYSDRVYKKTVNTMFYFVFCSAILKVIDVYFGTQIFSDKVLMYGQTTRFPFPTEYALFYLLLTLSGYFKFNDKKRFAIVIIFIVIYILSLTRSTFIAVLVGMSIVLFMTGQLKLSKRNVGLITALVISFFVIIGKNDGFKQRFLEGVDEIQSIKSGSNSEGNMQFRLMLLAERADYVFKNPYSAATGIQALPEESFPTIFHIGLPDKKKDRTIQVDTGDIAWALIIMRLGLIGGFIFCLLWIKTSLILYNKHNLLSISGFAFLISWILLSFCSTQILNASYWLFIFIIIRLSYSTEKYK